MDLQRRRQLFVFDRLLVRLFHVLKDAVVLKGGLVIELRLARARTTKDIDLRMIGSPDDVLARMQEAGRLDLGDYLQFEVVADRRHPGIAAEGMAYRGLRYRAEARLAAKLYGTPFGIDVAFGEPMHGRPDEVEGSTFLDFAGLEPGRFRIYPLETHIAEKLHAYTLPRKRPNSRVKDFPDIALLATARDIDGAMLRAAIDRTFDHRATHPVPASVPQPPSAWEPVYGRIAANDGLIWRTLKDVTEAVRSFLDPVLAGASTIWDPETWAWSEGEHDAL
ncbi:MAG: nucleotidyl transferase AbiEii/AbiGii toxin family protein [Nannocystaceae bacterium]|nr:nucleotidyl transferase AbiEii/AbiGii toxin family protein [Nannocystaceae bacterium]